MKTTAIRQSLLAVIGSMILLSCDADPFPVGEEFDAGFEVPFVTTHTFNFKTGSSDITGVQGNIKIISGADVQNLIASSPGSPTQSPQRGVIGGVVVNRFGSPVANVAIGQSDVAGNPLKDADGKLVMGVKNAAGEIISPLFYNSINGAPEFINIKGTGESGGFTVFNVPPGEVFIQAIRGGRGNGRLTTFPGGVSLTTMEVIPVPLPFVNIIGLVREFDEESPVAQAVIVVPGLQSEKPMTTNRQGAFSGSGFISDSKLIFKITASGHVDTYQEVTTALSQIQAGTVSLDIRKNLISISMQDIAGFAQDASVALKSRQGIIIATLVQIGTRRNNARVRATDRSGRTVGDIFYFNSETQRPDPRLIETSTNGRVVIFNLPPGETHLTIDATSETVTGIKAKSTATAIVPTFADAVFFKKVTLQGVHRASNDDPMTINLSGRVTEENGVTVVGNARISIHGLNKVFSSNAAGSYLIEKNIDPSVLTPVMPKGRYLFRVEKTGHLTTYQTIMTGSSDLNRDLTLVTKGSKKMVAGRGMIMGRVINVQAGAEVRNVVIEVTQMIDTANRVLATEIPVGKVSYHNGDDFDSTLSTSSDNGRFLITDLPPGLNMIKTVSSDDSGNKIVQTFADGLTLSNIFVNHISVAVPVSGKVADLSDPLEQSQTGFTLSVLGQKGSFSSAAFDSGILLATNSQFVIKVSKNGFPDTYNFHLKTALTTLPDQKLFTLSRAQIAALAKKTGLSLDPEKGVIVGEVTEPGLKTSDPLPLGAGPSALVAGFFDEDNRVDLAVVLASNEVAILLGQGDGRFDNTKIPEIAVGSDPRSIAVGDFDEDGRLDLAVANSGSDSITILFGRPGGDFEPRSQAITDGLGTAPRFITTADIDGDETLDLIVANEGSDNLSLLFGDGSGDFQARGTAPCKSPCSTGQAPVAIAIGDFDADGKPDLAVANAGSNNVTLILSRGTSTAFSVGPDPSALVSQDFNGDGILDLVVANAGDNTVTTLIGDGRGGFNPIDCLPKTPDETDEINEIDDCPIKNGNKPQGITLLDFDRDGRLDLALVNEGSLEDPPNVSLLLGDGNGGFRAASQTFSVGALPRDLLAADFNADGQADLAVGNAGSGDLSMLLSRSQAVEGVVVEAREDSGSHIGEVFYFKEDLSGFSDESGQKLQQTSKSGRYIVFNVPVGRIILRAKPGDEADPLSGNSLLTLFKADTLSYSQIAVNRERPTRVKARGVACRPLGEICTRVAGIKISFLGSLPKEICFKAEECISSSKNGTYTVTLPAHNQFVIKTTASKALLPGDSDGDGIPDGVDNCANLSNTDQRDDNQNGTGDACEFFSDDDDLDGILNVDDNCPITPNPEQEDEDGDGIGDACIQRG